MRHFLLPILFIFLHFSLFSQDLNRESLKNEEKPEVYLDLTLYSQEDIQQLSMLFSIDDLRYEALSESYNVRIWLAKKDYQHFLDLNIPFTYSENNGEKAVAMAYSYEEMLGWNKYPTYSTYLAMMDSFQKKYPTLCKIDTILAATPRNHAILAAHISTSLHTPTNKPEFLYSSTMHGDEVTGYYCMLRLIHYLLSNYDSDEEVRQIVNNVNLWICPLENPDGTYYSGNNTIGSSPTSTRSNSNGVDLNRVYPNPLVAPSQLEPEVSAMVQFFAQRHFVISANFHGGAELANYPWDSWTSRQRKHSDEAWWRYVARNYADTCQRYGGSYYFDDMNDGITNGGDWYVIYGSRQDYLNYYEHCREITLEISSSKTPSASTLPNYWNANRRAMLNYIKEALYGFRGIVFNAYTQQPIHAEIFINQHDSVFSQVYSHLPIGNYHRPIKAGTYSVTFSAEGYCPRTFTITTRDKQVVLFHVALTPCDEDGNVLPDTTHSTPNDDLISYWEDDSFHSVDYADGETPIDGQVDATHYATGVQTNDLANLIKIYPNPTSETAVIYLKSISLDSKIRYQCYDLYGKLLFENYLTSDKTLLPLSAYPAGLYLIKLYKDNSPIVNLKLIKN